MSHKDKANGLNCSKDAEELTPFAITTRYPGVEEKVTKKEASRAIDIAERVRQVVKGFLAKVEIDLSA
ncbi:MAG: HEPN domain-containing protein [Candidatus Omnitrophota bacterium]